MFDDRKGLIVVILAVLLIIVSCWQVDGAKLKKTVVNGSKKQSHQTSENKNDNNNYEKQPERLLHPRPNSRTGCPVGCQCILADLSQGDTAGLLVQCADTHFVDIGTVLLYVTASYPSSEITWLVLYNNTFAQSTLRQSSFYDTGVTASLRYLAVEASNIDDIEPMTFSRLTALRTLSLRSLRLTTLRPGALAGLKLEVLDLSGNNLTSIERHFFDSMTVERLAINYANLSSLTADRFGSVIKHLRALEIEGNKLRSINGAIEQYINNMDFIKIAHNPWHCGPSLLWLKQLYDAKREVFRLESNEDLYCSSPQALAGRYFSDIFEYEFSPNLSTSTTTTSTSTSTTTSTTTTRPTTTQSSTKATLEPVTTTSLTTTLSKISTSETFFLPLITVPPSHRPWPFARKILPTITSPAFTSVPSTSQHLINSTIKTTITTSQEFVTPTTSNTPMAIFLTFPVTTKPHRQMKSFYHKTSTESTTLRTTNTSESTSVASIEIIEVEEPVPTISTTETVSANDVEQNYSSQLPSIAWIIIPVVTAIICVGSLISVALFCICCSSRRKSVNLSSQQPHRMSQSPSSTSSDDRSSGSGGGPFREKDAVIYRQRMMKKAGENGGGMALLREHYEPFIPSPSSASSESGNCHQNKRNCVFEPEEETNPQFLSPLIGELRQRLSQPNNIPNNNQQNGVHSQQSVTTSASSDTKGSGGAGASLASLPMRTASSSNNNNSYVVC